MKICVINSSYEGTNSVFEAVCTLPCPCVQKLNMYNSMIGFLIRVDTFPNHDTSLSRDM